MEHLTDEQKIALANKLVRRTKWLLVLFVCMVAIILIIPKLPESAEEKVESPESGAKISNEEVVFGEDYIVDGIHTPSGMPADKGYELVVSTCGACHSLKLVKQNRATRQGWEDMIRWMQETQKLWDLGDNEATILDYLAKNYAPEKKGRRQNLKVEEWYELEG